MTAVTEYKHVIAVVRYTGSMGSEKCIGSVTSVKKRACGLSLHSTGVRQLYLQLCRSATPRTAGWKRYCAKMQKYNHNCSVYKPTALLAAIGGAPSWRRVACDGLVGTWAADVRRWRHRWTMSSRKPTNTGTAIHGTITCINSVPVIAVASSSSVNNNP